jgi:hypothetical protein
LKSSAIDLPLHGGHAPPYLIRRMIRLSHAISKVIIDEYGQQEFLRRLSDPLWFQAFGCVLGFDWHSSGVTTVVTGVLKQALKADVDGISIAGGKGKKSTTTKKDIPELAEKYYNLSSAKINDLLYASRITAKVDNAAVQDGYSLYHHVIFFDQHGDWAIIQQGMNPINGMARRYHWISDNVKSFILEPHSGIISEHKSANVLNMTSIDSADNQRTCVDLATGNTDNLRSSVSKVSSVLASMRGDTLDRWFISNSASEDEHNGNNNFIEHYEMPRKLNWDLFKRIYDIHPQKYEQLISISGVGPATVRALSLIGEIIYGSKASWQDPVKYNFAHGGKDGVPYPLARNIYDNSIRYLSSAIEGAEIERDERIQSLKKLAEYSARIFNKQGQDEG